MEADSRRHPLVRYQSRRTNSWTYIRPDAPELAISSSTGLRTIRPRHGLLHRVNRVTPLTTKFFPLRSSVSVSTPINNKFGKTIVRSLPVDILTPFGNEMNYFNIKKIDKDFNLFKTTPAVYEEVKGMYTRGALETSISPVTEIKKFEYSEIIYPSEENMYLNEVRQKADYQNNFWIGGQQNRLDRAGPTIHGRTTYGKLAQWASDESAASIWPLDTSTGSMNNLVDDSKSITNQRFYLRWGHVDEQSRLFGAGEGELVNRWSYPLKWSGGKFTHSSGSVSASTARLQPEAGPQYAMPQMLHATSSISSPTQPPLVTSSGSRGQEILGIRVTEDPNLYPDGPHFSDANTANPSTPLPLSDERNWLGYIPIFATQTAWDAPTLAGKVEERNLLNTTRALAANVQTVKFVSQSSTPWQSDYDEFKKDVRTKAKDYTVVPEFRIEDHLKDYILNKGSDFLAEQNSLFRMVGMPSGSDAQAANSAEQNFFKVYGTTDFLKHFEVLKNDLEEHYEPSALTLQCNAYLKFNPYDGFYPATRTLQLAAALSASYGQHIKYSGPGLLDPNGDRSTNFDEPIYGETAGVNTDLAFRNFITPLFAPGIMFNTIKSGIACDWPVMLTGSKIYKVRCGASDYWGLGMPNPELDQELHNYLDDVYSASAPKVTLSKRPLSTVESIVPLKNGRFKLKEDYRKLAIQQAMTPASASVGGISNGLAYSGVFDPTGSFPGYKPGYYTVKADLKDLPGLKESTATFTTNADADGIITAIFISTVVEPAVNVGRWDKRIPFEAIISPENYLKDIKLYDYTAHPSASLDVTASWDGTGDDIYSLMTNNFLASVPDFFLRNGSFTSIASRPQDELNLYANAGDVYGMRIKMYRSLNRQRDYSAERVAALRALPYDVPQDPQDDIGLHETFTMYSRSSAFGYPVLGRTHTIRNKTSGDAGHVNNVNTNSPTNTTYPFAIARQLTASYGMNISEEYINLVGGQYSTYGTDECPRVLFGTGSFRSTASGTLDSLQGYNWSYTPPYMHGEAWCDIIFKPTVSKTYSLGEILDSVTVVQRRVDPGFQHVTASTGNKSPQFIPNGYHSSSLYSAENINANAMQLDSCLNLRGLGKVKAFAYSNVGATGRAQVASVKRTVGDSPAWIIQPKFETPMLNFSPLTADKGGTAPRPITDDLLTLPVYGSGTVARGMWHQFGTIPNKNEGVWLEVGDIPKSWLENHPSVEQGADYAPFNATGSFDLHRYKRLDTGERMKSLAGFVGMDTTPKRLGNLRDKITVSEAVVAVPFIEKNNQRHFFKIDPHMVDIILGEETYRRSDQSDEPGDTLRTLVRQMDKYVFPPVFDFVKNRNLVQPVAMYVFEFNMTFDKNDLSYIWQNLMPPSAEKFTTSTSTITHNLLINELMGYSNKKTGKPLSDKVKWMVFKVKQRSSTNYYDKVIASTPELDRLDKISRSRQVTLGSNSDAKYGFNWPYDHFSIVEMAQIKASVEFSALPQNIPTILKVGDAGSRPTKQGQYVKPPIPGQGVLGSTNPRLGSSGGSTPSSGPSISGVEVTPGPLQPPDFPSADRSGLMLNPSRTPGFAPSPAERLLDPSLQEVTGITNEEILYDMDRYSSGPLAGVDVTAGPFVQPADDGTTPEILINVAGGGSPGLSDINVGNYDSGFKDTLTGVGSLADFALVGSPLSGYGYGGY